MGRVNAGARTLHMVVPDEEIDRYIDIVGDINGQSVEDAVETLHPAVGDALFWETYTVLSDDEEYEGEAFPVDGERYMTVLDALESSYGKTVVPPLEQQFCDGYEDFYRRYQGPESLGEIRDAYARGQAKSIGGSFLIPQHLGFAGMAYAGSAGNTSDALGYLALGFGIAAMETRDKWRYWSGVRAGKESEAARHGMARIVHEYGDATVHVTDGEDLSEAVQND